MNYLRLIIVVISISLFVSVSNGEAYLSGSGSYQGYYTDYSGSSSYSAPVYTQGLDQHTITVSQEEHYSLNEKTGAVTIRLFLNGNIPVHISWKNLSDYQETMYYNSGSVTIDLEKMSPVLAFLPEKDDESSYSLQSYQGPLKDVLDNAQKGYCLDKVITGFLPDINASIAFSAPQLFQQLLKEMNNQISSNEKDNCLVDDGKKADADAEKNGDVVKEYRKECNFTEVYDVFEECADLGNHWELDEQDAIDFGIEHCNGECFNLRTYDGCIGKCEAVHHTVEIPGGADEDGSHPLIPHYFVNCKCICK